VTKLLTKISFHTSIAKSGDRKRIIIIATKFLKQIEAIVKDKREVRGEINDET
jgi:hypothetical protein